MLDAIVWILHGHVFATAMTGNTVLMAVALLVHNDPQAVQHLIPLVTFAVGILLGWAVLRRVRAARPVHHIALLIQVVSLAIAGMAPARFPSTPLVTLIALTASVQIATFQRIDSVSYNSTFITGNFRTLLEALYDYFHATERDAATLQLRVIVPVCFAFFVGALTGAALAPRLQNHSFWAVAVVLLLVRLLLG